MDTTTQEKVPAWGENGWSITARSFSAKPRSMINCEHPATLQTYVYPRYQEDRGMVRTNTTLAQQWYAGGPSRPQLQTITTKAFREFGAPLYLDPNARPPAGDLGQFWRFLPGVASSEFYHYFHTDQETPDVVPWTGSASDHASLREDHRRRQQTPVERVTTGAGIGSEALNTFQQPQNPGALQINSNRAC